MSAPSQQALQTLQNYSAQLEGLEQKVIDVARDLGRGILAMSQARTELAYVEAQGHKLETLGVDSVYCSELTSGKATAKAEKKALLSRLERLFEGIDAEFKKLKAT